MARTQLAIVAAVVLTGCGGGNPSPRPAPKVDGATVVARRQVGPRLVDLTIRSPALGRTAQVRLLTPVGWHAGAARRWPVLWLLHGCCDTYRSWSQNTD